MEWVTTSLRLDGSQEGLTFRDVVETCTRIPYNTWETGSWINPESEKVVSSRSYSERVLSVGSGRCSVP